MILTYKKGKGDKIHISLDGEYFMTVDEMYFESLYLRNGQEIDREGFLELKSLIEVRRAYNYAVSLLSRRDHSYKELLTKLKNKGYGEGAEEALEKLCQSGYIDDERFANLYARELINLKGFGIKRVEQELYRKGVDRDIIREVLDSADFPEERLTEIIRRKYIRNLNDEKGVRRTINSLIRLGYSYGEIRSALEEVNNELEVFDE
ncbi:MAG: regulatory protein RecX [Clostridia bacterium]|nr:regulatory protein RecX [Clostridia bacterium]